jgi:hypothetical protein
MKLKEYQQTVEKKYSQATDLASFCVPCAGGHTSSKEKGKLVARTKAIVA